MLARYNRRVLQFRRDGPLCDLIVAGGPSPSPRLGMTALTVVEKFEHFLRPDAHYARHPRAKNNALRCQSPRDIRGLASLAPVPDYE